MYVTGIALLFLTLSVFILAFCHFKIIEKREGFMMMGGGWYGYGMGMPPHTHEETQYAAVLIGSNEKGNTYAVYPAKYMTKAGRTSDNIPKYVPSTEIVPSTTTAPPLTTTPKPTTSKPAGNIEEQMSAFVSRWHGGDDTILSKSEVAGLAERKLEVANACDILGLKNTALHILCLTLGMIESERMNTEDRDITKDPGGINYCGEGCINLGFANLNISLIRKVMDATSIPGLTNDNLKAINCPADNATAAPASCNPKTSILAKQTMESVQITVYIIKAAVDIWGIEKFLDYMRGGETLFRRQDDYFTTAEDPFNVRSFKKGVALTYSEISRDTSMLMDGRRAYMNIAHV